MQKVNIGIVGGAGYTGGELLRVLLRHPNAHIALCIAQVMRVNR